MQTKKNQFDVLQMVQIPSSHLLKEVKKELRERESFIDADEDLKEQIFSADVFEAILGEQYDMPDGNPLKISAEAIKQVEELMDEVIEYMYVQITNI